MIATVIGNRDSSFFIVGCLNCRLQRQILELEKKMEAEALSLEEANQQALEWKAKVDVGKLRMKIIKDRVTSLQSVLKSLQVW